MTKSVGVRATGKVNLLAPRQTNFAWQNKAVGTSPEVWYDVGANASQQPAIKQGFSLVLKVATSAAPGTILASSTLHSTWPGSGLTSVKAGNSVSFNLNVNFSAGTDYIFTTEVSSPGFTTATTNSVALRAATAPGQIGSYTTANGGTGQAYFVWTAPSNNGGSPINNYFVQLVNNSTGSVATSTNTGTTTNAYFSGVSAGTYYARTFAANAVAGQGASLNSATVSVSAAPYFPPFFPFFPFFPYFPPFFPFFPSFGGGCCPAGCASQGGFCSGCNCFY